LLISEVKEKKREKRKKKKKGKVMARGYGKIWGAKGRISGREEES